MDERGVEGRAEGWEEKDLGMRVVLRMAMIMKMTGGGGNKCDDDNEDDASGGGDADHSNGDDEGEMIIVLQHTIVASGQVSVE